MIFKPEFLKFMTIYDNNSISVAADRLDLYQGALSKTLLKLEKELNEQLFIRSNRGIVPTQYAHILYKELQKQLISWQHFQKKNEDISDKFISGTVKIGGHPSVVQHFSSQIVNWNHSFPNLEFVFIFDRSPKITRMVLNHEVDLAFVVRPQKFNELVIRKIKKDYIAKFSYTKNYSNITYYNPDQVNSQIIIEKENDSKLIAVADYYLCAEFAKLSNGCAILPESISKKLNFTHQVGSPFFSGDICLIYRSDHRSGTVIKFLLESYK